MPGPLDYLKQLLTPSDEPQDQNPQEAIQAALHPRGDISLDGPKIGANPHPWRDAILGGIKDFAHQWLDTDDYQNPNVAPPTRVLGAVRDIAGKINSTPAGQAANIGMAVIPGMFSRVDRAVEGLPNSVHPNKVASTLLNQANPEEVRYRQLGEFLRDAGDQKISKTDLQQHLADNPAPDITVKRLGEPKNGPAIPDGAGGLVYPQSPNAEPTRFSHISLKGPRENYREDLLQLNRPKGKTALQRYDEMVAKLDRERGEGWSSGDLSPEDEATLQQLWNQANLPWQNEPEKVPDYTGGHFREPNVLVHVRHDERQLPGELAPLPPFPEGQPSWADLEAQGWRMETSPANYDGSGQPYQHDTAFYDPNGVFRGARTGHREAPEDIANEFAIDHAAREYNDQLDAAKEQGIATGSKGRFLNEVQSDWHQSARNGLGYQQPRDPALILQRQNELGRAHNALEQTERQLIEQHGFANRNELYDAYANETADNPHYKEFLDHLNRVYGTDYAVSDLPEAEVNKWMQLQQEHDNFGLSRLPLESRSALSSALHARDAAERALSEASSPKGGVPDAPWKDSSDWAKLALKQQLLDVAKRPDLDWIGHTTGAQQGIMEGLSHHIANIDYEFNPDTHEWELAGYGHNGDGPYEANGVPDERLHEYIGHGAAKALREHMVEQMGADRAPSPPMTHAIVDRDDDTIQNIYTNQAEAERALHQWLEDDPNHGGDYGVRPLNADELQRINEEQADEHAYDGVTSGKLPVDARMDNEDAIGLSKFYDKILPDSLAKLLKPFGGKVEKVNLPTSEPQHYTASPGRFINSARAAFTSHVYDNAGNWVASAWPPVSGKTISAKTAAAFDYLKTHPGARSLPIPGAAPEAAERGQQLADFLTKTRGTPTMEPIWFARLTPEMKAEILKKGFPLLAYLGLANVGKSFLGGRGDEDQSGGTAR